MMALDLLLGAAGTALLCLPGTWVGRRWGLPAPLLFGFIGGAVLLHAIVLCVDSLGLGLTASVVGGAWIVAATALMAAARQGKYLAAVSHGTDEASKHWLLLLAALPAMAIATWRAVTQPLSGPDTVFRWDWLAQHMVSRATLAYYPPTTGADYTIYAWPDGIAPLVASLYFWMYTVAGGVRATLTSAVVLLQFALLLVAVYALGRKIASRRAGAFAVALLAASPVAIWATVMGQETGCTALALVAMLLWLPASPEEESTPAMVAAGCAAALGGLAREYGLIWILLGGGLALVRRLSARSVVIFSVTALLGAGPWYLRNAWLTGNPLFNLDLAGWFAVNRVHALLMTSYQQDFGWAHLPPEAARLLLTNCAVALLAMALGGVAAWRGTRALLVAILVVVALWFTALGYTAAGFVSALRVLSPAIALAAVVGAVALARFIPGRPHYAAAAVALLLLGLHSALRALTLPANPYRVPASRWFTVGNAVRDFHASSFFDQIANVIGRERALVLGPNALLSARGATTIPLWSPEVGYLFDPTLAPSQVGRSLQHSRIGFVFLTRGTANERFLAHSAFFRDPGPALQRIWGNEDYVLLRVTAESPGVP